MDKNINEMKSKRNIILHQIELQERIQKIGINLLTCGNCGGVLLHESKNETVECLCGSEIAEWNCTDYWYNGMENNKEFND